MKTFKILMFVAIAFGLSAFSLSAEEKADKKSGEPALKNQTHCPVMGGKIDSTVFTDIQGQRVYHCCPGCSKPLKEEPDKYFKKAAAEGVLFENTQTNCPVSGEKLTEKTSFVDYDGRRVYFCCDNCQEPFGNDPQRYLSIIDLKGAKETKREEPDHSSHGSH